MTYRTGIRRATYSHPRRSPRVRRASTRLTPVRAAALLGMLLSAGAIYGLSSSAVFGLHDVSIGKLRFIDESRLRDSVGVAVETNLFALSTDEVASRLRALPAVAAADVEVRLPDTLSVTVREREPILVWAAGPNRFLVDRDGVLFGTATETTPDIAHVPAMTDTRAASATLGVGGRLDAIDLDAATRLGSLRPSDVGSTAAALAVSVTDENGFVVKSMPGGWSAIFGFYTPSLRRPDLIPGQVRLLRSLLAGREATVERVILASDTSGTFIPRPSPAASPTPKP
jgi:cell division septal protein FtsQ